MIWWFNNGQQYVLIICTKKRLQLFDWLTATTELTYTDRAEGSPLTGGNPWVEPNPFEYRLLINKRKLGHTTDLTIRNLCCRTSPMNSPNISQHYLFFKETSLQCIIFVAWNMSKSHTIFIQREFTNTLRLLCCNILFTHIIECLNRYTSTY